MWGRPRGMNVFFLCRLWPKKHTFFLTNIIVKLIRNHNIVQGSKKRKPNGFTRTRSSKHGMNIPMHSGLKSLKWSPFSVTRAKRATATYSKSDDFRTNIQNSQVWIKSFEFSRQKLQGKYQYIPRFARMFTKRDIFAQCVKVFFRLP